MFFIFVSVVIFLAACNTKNINQNSYSTQSDSITTVEFFPNDKNEKLEIIEINNERPEQSHQELKIQEGSNSIAIRFSWDTTYGTSDGELAARRADIVINTVFGIAFACVITLFYGCHYGLAAAQEEDDEFTYIFLDKTCTTNINFYAKKGVRYNIAALEKTSNYSILTLNISGEVIKEIKCLVEDV